MILARRSFLSGIIAAAAAFVGLSPQRFRLATWGDDICADAKRNGIWFHDWPDGSGGWRAIPDRNGDLTLNDVKCVAGPVP